MNSQQVVPQGVPHPQPVPVPAAHPGEHCQCWNTAPPSGQQAHPQFGFPIPFPGGLLAPGVVATEAFPNYSNENSQGQPQNQDHHDGHSVPHGQASPQSEGNVKVVVSGPDHQFLDSAPVSTKVLFPKTSSEGSSNEPIAAESVPESSVVVPAPVGNPVPSPSETPNTQFGGENSGSESPTPAAKAHTTFAGTVPGGSTTPQELKGKQFSIGKSKFTASVAAKNVKKQ